MKLHEIMTSPYDYKLKTYDGNGEATFTNAEGHVISVGIAVNDVEDDNGDPVYKAVEVGFDRDGEYLMTGEGDAARIFATVIAIIKEFAAKYSPDMIFFSSRKTEGSRTKFYKSLIKRFSSGSGYDEHDISKAAPELDDYIKNKIRTKIKDEIIYVVKSGLK